MSTQPDYSTCSTWQEIAAAHRKTLRLPASSVSSDPKLTEWKDKANASYDPPSTHEAGPSLASLVQNDSTKSIWTSKLDPILNGCDATAIVELTRSGKVCVQDVTQHFINKASIVHQATNALSHFFAKEAIERAKSLDAKRTQLEKEGKLDQLGQLFGLPMTIKGHMSYDRKGSQRGFVFDVLPDPASHPLVRRNLTQKQIELLTSTQGGYISENPVNSHLVSLLLEADAVIVGKTSMPQGVMHLDTRNNLYGQTLNPLNLALSPGGSSGGESAMVAGGGCALGVGSDIGGSIRQPCGMTGLYGLRPTTQRLPYGGVRSTMPGNEGVGSSLGPMATSLRDIELFMSSVVNEQTRPWEREHTTLPTPWRIVDSLLCSSASSPRTLVVGVMMEDGVVRPTTPVRRALSHWVDKLQAYSAGNGGPRIELRRWDPRDLHKRAWDLIRSLYFMDSGKMFHLLAKATGEPLLPLTEFILSAPFVRPATADLDAEGVETGRKPDEMSATDVWATVRTREAFRKEFLARWNELALDCLLCPVMGSVAPRPGKIKYWGYTSVFNLVDYPGVVFPSGLQADSQIDEQYETSDRASADGFGYEPRKGKADWMSSFDRENQEEYEQHRGVFDRAPVGLQLIGRRYMDEELIKYAELLQHVVQTS